MADALTVFVSAAVGGLVGSVLQPGVVYVFDGLRARDRRREHRERTFRRAMEAQLAFGRRLDMANLIRSAAAKNGAFDWETMREAMGDITAPPLWQPERFTDPELRELAIAHTEQCAIFFILISSVPPDEDGLAATRKTVVDLEERITRRMDQLDWPSVDE